jgi:ubiquinone/menaquinone biosynthesis C-methylase UbiE
VADDKPTRGFFPDMAIADVWARRYEADLVPAVMLPCALLLADAVGIVAGDRVLDVACGTGALTRVVASRCSPSGSAVGVDLIPAMIEVAKGMNVESADFRVGDAAALPAVDADFDAVVCQQSMQFFLNRPAAAAEMHRVLRHGGRLGVACWAGAEINPWCSAIVDAFQAAGWADLAASHTKAFSLGDPDELGGILTAAGFTDVEVERVAFTAAWADLRGHFDKARLRYPNATDSELEAYVTTVLEGFAPFMSGRAANIPMTTLIGTASKD